MSNISDFVCDGEKPRLPLAQWRSPQSRSSRFGLASMVEQWRLVAEHGRGSPYCSASARLPPKGAFAELEAKGFLMMMRDVGNGSGRLATTWRATDKGCKGDLPTNDWKAWQLTAPAGCATGDRAWSRAGTPSPFRFKRKAA